MSEKLPRRKSRPTEVELRAVAARAGRMVFYYRLLLTRAGPVNTELIGLTWLEIGLGPEPGRELTAAERQDRASLESKKTALETRAARAVAKLQRKLRPVEDAISKAATECPLPRSWLNMGEQSAILSVCRWIERSVAAWTDENIESQWKTALSDGYRRLSDATRVLDLEARFLAYHFHGPHSGLRGQRDQAAENPVVTRKRTRAEGVLDYLIENAWRRPIIKTIQLDTGIAKSTIADSMAWKAYRRVTQDGGSPRDVEDALKVLRDRGGALAREITAQQEDASRERRGRGGRLSF